MIESSWEGVSNFRGEAICRLDLLWAPRLSKHSFSVDMWQNPKTANQIAASAQDFALSFKGVVAGSLEGEIEESKASVCAFFVVFLHQMSGSPLCVSAAD